MTSGSTSTGGSAGMKLAATPVTVSSNGAENSQRRARAAMATPAAVSASSATAAFMWGRCDPAYRGFGSAQLAERRGPQRVEADAADVQSSAGGRT